MRDLMRPCFAVCPQCGACRFNDFFCIKVVCEVCGSDMVEHREYSLALGLISIRRSCHDSENDSFDI